MLRPRRDPGRRPPLPPHRRPETPLSAARSPGERAALLAVARAALRQAAGTGPAPKSTPGPAATGPAGAGGAFAEIRVAGSLRGSMGCFAPGASLTESVASAVRAAARADPRFAPLRPDEVEGALLRISLVGPLRPFGGPASIAPGDGIRVRRHWQRGTLLPGGAPEPGRDATAFLRRACLKAGLPPGAWEAEGTRVDLFSVEELEGGDGP